MPPPQHFIFAIPFPAYNFMLKILI